MTDTMKNPTAQIIEGNWKQFKGQLQETWGNLTDDDLDRYEGQQDQLEGFISEKTGEKRSEIRARIDKLAHRIKEAV